MLVYQAGIEGDDAKESRTCLAPLLLAWRSWPPSRPNGGSISSTRILAKFSKQLADEVIADQDYGSPEISIPPSRLAMTKMSGCGELSLTVNQKSAQASTVT
jgi:hypothetical protein